MESGKEAARHVCTALGSLGVRLREGDVLAGARAEARAKTALVRALHDLSLLHSAGWPAGVGEVDIDHARVAAASPESELLFAQQHLHACEYPRAALYFIAPSGFNPSSSVDGLEPTADSSSEGLAPAVGADDGQIARELLLALGWLVTRAGALRVASMRGADNDDTGLPPPLWPRDTCESAHNAARASAAEVSAQRKVGALRRSSVSVLARAAGRPGPSGEPPPTLAEAIVAAGHVLLALLGALALALRRLACAHLAHARLLHKAQVLGRALRLPTYSADAAATAARGGASAGASWSLFELWACTLGGGGEQMVPLAAAGAPGAQPAAADAASVRSKRELKRVLSRLRAGTEARVHERAFFRWLATVAETHVRETRKASAALGADGGLRMAELAGALPVHTERLELTQMLEAHATQRQRAARALALHAPGARAPRAELETSATAATIRTRVAPVVAAVAAWPAALERARGAIATWPAAEHALGPAPGGPPSALALVGGRPLVPTTFVLAAEERKAAALRPAAASRRSPSAAAAGDDGVDDPCAELQRELEASLAAERAESREELRRLLEPFDSFLCWGF